MKGIGTLIDITVIIVAGTAGLIVGRRLNKNIQENLTIVLGLVALGSGLKMAVESGQFMIVLLSLTSGVFLAEFIKFLPTIRKIQGKQGSHVEACLKATFLSLVGPLAILGPIEEGSGHGFSLLILKSGFDGISTLLLSAALGPGVLLSALPVGIVQGALTALSHNLNIYLTTTMLQSLSSLGGILILTVGMDLLQIKKMKQEAMLSALLIAPFIVVLGTKFGLVGP